jgi:hypothetical protein
MTYHCPYPKCRVELQADDQGIYAREITCHSCGGEVLFDEVTPLTKAQKARIQLKKNPLFLESLGAPWSK